MISIITPFTHHHRPKIRDPKTVFWNIRYRLMSLTSRNTSSTPVSIDPVSFQRGRRLQKAAWDVLIP